MTFNTGNPICSTDARDLSDNAENLDLAVNSLSQTFVDRLGVTRDTLEGVYQKSAYYRAGTFDAGYTLTNNRQTLAYGNVEYSWSGAFPKVVQAGSTPATTGGIGAGAWVDRTDVSLRAEITPSVTEALRRSYAEAGYNMVDGSFEGGGTLASTSDVLLHKASGIAYSWSGSFPKTVPSGATPTTSGGVGAGAWVDRTDLSLRSELSTNSGAEMVLTSRSKTVDVELAEINHSKIINNKIIAAQIEAMPTFRILSEKRPSDYIGDIYYSQNLNQGAISITSHVTMIGTYDPGTLTRDRSGFSIGPYDALTPCSSAVLVEKVLQTPFEVGTVTVQDVQTNTGTGEINQFVGLWVGNRENRVSAHYNVVTGNTYIECRSGGNPPVVYANEASGTTLQSGDKLSLCLNGVNVYALITKADGRQYRGSPVNVKSFFDFRHITLLESAKWFFGATSNGAGNVARWSKFEVSTFGAVGLRDFAWVKYEDGTPYVLNGKLYFTATCAGVGNSSGGNPYTASHQGIFSFDPITLEIKKTGRTLLRYDGYVAGHHAGQILFNRFTKQWLITATDFGTSDLHGDLKILRAQSFDRNILHTNGVYFAEVVNFGIANSVWDANWMYIGGEWQIAITVSDSPSKAGLFTASKDTPFAINGGTWITHASGVAREGTKLVNTGGVYRLLAGETGGSVYSYSVSPFAVVGPLTTPAVSDGTPAQHFDIIPFQRDGVVEFFALLFDTNFLDGISYTWGAAYVCKNGFGGETIGNSFDYVNN